MLYLLWSYLWYLFFTTCIHVPAKTYYSTTLLWWMFSRCPSYIEPPYFTIRLHPLGGNDMLHVTLLLVDYSVQHHLINTFFQKKNIFGVTQFCNVFFVIFLIKWLCKLFPGFWNKPIKYKWTHNLFVYCIMSVKTENKVKCRSA